MESPDDLPLILAGPILRHCSPGQLTLWLVCSCRTTLEFRCHTRDGDTLLASRRFPPDGPHHVGLGTHAHAYLLALEPESPFPTDCWLGYDLGLAAAEPDEQGEAHTRWLSELVPALLYPHETRPQFVLKSRIDQLLHGSCRKPHHTSADTLPLADQLLVQAGQSGDAGLQPALLLMTGDQIYADDVAGPMLHAIHQVAERLQLGDEQLQAPDMDRCSSGRALHRHEKSYYRRTRLLPDTKANARLMELFFSGSRKPIFTSANADNHLITLAEMLGMYLLVWSPVLWEGCQLNDFQASDPALQQRYQTELQEIRRFIADLPAVRRVLAHLPVYMIFDDHDITDDWNLNLGWEQSAYAHPFSLRIIGNALIAYLLCQAWGNQPDQFETELLEQVRNILRQPDAEAHDALIQQLLRYEGWQYSLPTRPKLVVLDTRTRRWRSQSHASLPSGLLDWEALSELQQELLHEDSVILVSPAPIFGVKLIEIVQRIFTWFGHALTVDAENWMAHPGSASAILNIFQHRRTPQHVVILSGDVHYSFVYDVRLRFSPDSPHIWQITSSGIKNAFPPRLLRPFDWLNRWLFATWSPLNVFTRRRHMRIRPRRPSEHAGRYRHQRLVNGSNLGRVMLDPDGVPQVIEVLMPDAGSIHFTEGYEHEWHD
ncbi:MAG: alkaline phosphatase family protein [Thiothrix sp.]|nr:alkaline phosphatase family protein [Thiothrix sp.]